MNTFTDTEIRRLTSLRDRADEAVAKMMAKLAEQERGGLAYRLGWDTGDLMFQDLLRSDYHALIDMNGKEETKATLETLIDHFTRQILTWRPSHSSNPFSNIEEELKQRVRQTILEELVSFKQLRLREDTNSDTNED